MYGVYVLVRVPVWKMELLYKILATFDIKLYESVVALLFRVRLKVDQKMMSFFFGTNSTKLF